MSRFDPYKAVLTFLLKSLVLGMIVLPPYAQVSHNQVKDVDCFYPKLTHSAEHLILGISRAATGIAPEVLKAELGLKGRMLNFAFVGAVTPYGVDYHQLVRRKISKGKETPVFILSVNPDNLSQNRYKALWSEGAHPIYDLFLVNINPNVEYFLRKIRRKKSTILDNDPPEKNESFRFFEGGWMGLKDRKGAASLEDEAAEIDRISTKKIPSPERIQALSELINALSKRGTVVLVRMPVTSKVRRKETQIFPGFNQEMLQLAEQYKVPFLDYSERAEAYSFFDANHLNVEGAIAFTHDLAQDIKTILRSDH